MTTKVNQATLASWGIALERGQSIRETCPQCGSKKDFVVSKLEDGRLAWLCHRASCQFRGTTGAHKPSPAGQLLRSHVQPPELALQELPHESAIWRYLAYQDALRGRLKQDANSGAVYIPVHDLPYMEQVGFQLRWYDGRPDKVKSYLTTQLPRAMMAVYQVSPDTTAVIVEDAISALKVSGCGVNAVALLGTTFSQEQAQALRKDGIDSLVFWLDWDARDKAMRYSHHNALLFKTSYFATPKDPKDLSYLDIKKAILSWNKNLSLPYSAEQILKESETGSTPRRT